MAVDTNTYGTVERLETDIGDIVTGRMFTTTSIPTKSQAEAALDDNADIINSHLITAGYSIPVVLATNPEAFGVLKRANEMGAAVQLLTTVPTEAWVAIGNDDVARSRLQYYQLGLKRVLDMIDDIKLPAAQDQSIDDRLIIGSATNSEGKTNKPFFQRNTYDYPGSRSLTEV